MHLHFPHTGAATVQTHALYALWKYETDEQIPKNHSPDEVLLLALPCQAALPATRHEAALSCCCEVSAQGVRTQGGPVGTADSRGVPVGSSGCSEGNFGSLWVLESNADAENQEVQGDSELEASLIADCAEGTAETAADSLGDQGVLEGSLVQKDDAE